MNDQEYTKLAPPSTHQGAFVKTLVGPGGDVGFGDNFNVHKTWMKKCLSFDAVMETLQRSEEDREDINAKLSSVDAAVNKMGEFCITIDDREFKPTEWALGQLSTKINVPSSTFLKVMTTRDGFDWEDADICVRVVRNELRRCDKDKTFKFRTYNDGTLRAMLSDKYAPVDNRWFLETINDILPDSLYSHWRSDEDTIYANVLIPNTFIDYGQDDSDYGGMLSIGNCEIGKRRISQVPSVFRSICMNGTIWDKTEGKDFVRKHLGKIDLAELRQRIVDNVEQQLPLVPDIVRKFLSTKSLEVKGSMKKILAGVCNTNKMTKKQSQEVLSQYVQYEKEHKNLFGVINAITRAGQEFDNSTWNTFDVLAGQLANTSESKWNSNMEYYNSMPDQFVNDIFV